MRLFIALGLLVACHIGNAQILKMGFENGSGTSGKLTPSNISAFGGELKFSEGISGKGAQIGNRPPKGIRLIFSEGFPTKSGSIVFWVKPVDWKYDDGSFHIFASLLSYGKNAVPEDLQNHKKALSGITFYKYGNKHMEKGGLGIVALSQCGGKTDWICSLDARKCADWIPGKWHLMALTWNNASEKKAIRFYIDGELVRDILKETSFMKFDGPVVALIGGYWGDKGESVIDEFEIFSEALNETQIYSIYEKAMEKVFAK